VVAARSRRMATMRSRTSSARARNCSVSQTTRMSSAS
jgi:hypothetical protein